jgi:Ca2+-transporting ATPase
MSILPEEIPVAFTTFMALGSRRLMQLGIIVKKIRTVEALGSATVICTDKTGTITENRMSLQSVYNAADHTLYEDGQWPTAVIRAAMWASEPVPFDPMEKIPWRKRCISCTHKLRPRMNARNTVSFMNIRWKANLP